jgi:NitT/TauT family transport system ATP-binding protein
LKELKIEEAYPRLEEFRTSPEYGAYCRSASDALHEAQFGRVQ